MRAALLGVVACVAGAFVLSPSSARAQSLSRDWHVTTEHATGTLHIVSIADGRIDATLLGAPAAGWLVDDVLVLRRPAADNAELWQGRVGHRPDGAAFLAGTVMVDTRLHPFFAVSEEPNPSELVPPTELPEESPSVSPPPTPGPSPPPQASEPLPESGFVGRWLAPTGSADVRREGSSIEVTMPDGTVHRGRMTGARTFVVGLRVACCKGELESPDTVRWEDGTVWRRAR